MQPGPTLQSAPTLQPSTPSPTAEQRAVLMQQWPGHSPEEVFKRALALQLLTRPDGFKGDGTPYSMDLARAVNSGVPGPAKDYCQATGKVPRHILQSDNAFVMQVRGRWVAWRGCHSHAAALTLSRFSATLWSCALFCLAPSVLVLCCAVVLSVVAVPMSLLSPLSLSPALRCYVHSYCRVLLDTELIQSHPLHLCDCHFVHHLCACRSTRWLKTSLL